jgi:hypothetical protein
MFKILCKMLYYGTKNNTGRMQHGKVLAGRFYRCMGTTMLSYAAVAGIAALGCYIIGLGV